MGGGALVDVSRSISAVSDELGQVAFPLRTACDVSGVFFILNNKQKNEVLTFEP